MIGIYKITSPSGKIYIGQSWKIHERKHHYKFSNCKNQHKLYNSLVKYGFDNHTFEVICELPKDVTQSILDQYEILYWQQYKDCGFKILNLREPGSRGKLSEEIKQKISNSSKGKIISEETKIKMGNSKRNIPKHSIISKQLIGFKNKHPKPKDFGNKIKNIKLGKSNFKINKIIIQYDSQMNYIKEWSSIKEAELYFRPNRIKIQDNIGKVCRGLTQSAYGFIWKYK